MSAADLALVAANLVYATSYVVTRVVLDGVPPATLALVRVGLAAAVLLPLARTTAAVRSTTADHVRVAAMGIVGFAGAFLLGHWGLARSTATNAALLIVVEPVTLLLLGPLLLGERLRPTEAVGAALALAGAVVVVLDGVPGLTGTLVPRWRGDVLLVLSAVAYAAYTLLGRPVLTRHPALPVTARSLAWATPALLPAAAAEWVSGRVPTPTPAMALGTLYLAVVITALGYLVWNWGLERVPAARAAVFLNLQPVVGALLGVAVLDEPAGVLTAAGAALVVTGLALTTRRAPS